MSQLSQQAWSVISGHGEFESTAAYEKARAALQVAERGLSFDAQAMSSSSQVERLASELVRRIRLYDQDNIYESQVDAQGHDIGTRHAGQHFLGSVDFINRTWMMDVAKHMPKGAHLHIHFNSCLSASFLIQQARNIDAMYIRSTLPLTTLENMDRSRISFMVLTLHEATHIRDINGTEEHVPLGNIFDKDYISNTWMSYKKFQNEFEFVDQNKQVLSKTPGAELWLERKLQFSEEEAHGAHQTGKG